MFVVVRNVSRLPRCRLSSGHAFRRPVTATRTRVIPTGAGRLFLRTVLSCAACVAEGPWQHRSLPQLDETQPANSETPRMCFLTPSSPPAAQQSCTSPPTQSAPPPYKSDAPPPKSAKKASPPYHHPAPAPSPAAQSAPHPDSHPQNARCTPRTSHHIPAPAAAIPNPETKAVTKDEYSEFDSETKPQKKARAAAYPQPG